MNAALPIDEVLPELLQALAEQPRVVLEAPPGAGKTTRVPLAMLDQGWVAGGKILMLEPRRLAARAAASFMAAQLGESVGERVGYRIRFEVRSGPNTRIEVLTEGLLTRMIQSDPELSGVAAVIFDEYHERNLEADLALGLALEAQAALRPDLRILVMSATLDGERLAQWLPAVRVRSPGQSFPVTVEHLLARSQESSEAHLWRAIDQAMARSEGDVLAFLPGKAEIGRALGFARGRQDLQLLPLHGELSIADQAAVLQRSPNGPRRVVLATNLAESSLTVPGVRAVVDSGLAREPRFDPRRGMSRLLLSRISEASATQRAGRAGRLGPGLCLRLWSASERLESGVRPEIANADLASLALQLASWGGEIRLLDAPPPGALAQARELLGALGALDADGKITALGRRLARSGTHPRLAAILEAATDPASIALACDLVALLEARDPLTGEARFEPDLLPRLRALQAHRSRRPVSGADRGALAAIEQIAGRWRSRRGLRQVPGEIDPSAAGPLLAAGYADRLGTLGGQDRYRLLQGAQAILPPSATLIGTPWLVAVDLGGEAGALKIRQAAAVDVAWVEQLLGERVQSVRRLVFDPAERAVQARQERRLGSFVLESRQVPTSAEDPVAETLLSGLRALGAAAIPADPELQQWLLRVRALREWLPDDGLPDFADQALLAELEQWLAPWLNGVRRLADFPTSRWREALSARLSHAQTQLLNEQAPTHLLVPSGHRRALRYTADGAPVLAVKLQELFGLAETPRIARGRVAVVLHLLSPAGRPVQVTADLRGFWDRTYPEVKKELKGRYPKHPWPDDPWSATATARAKPRR
ncbi:MAG: ATP-dependent helicase HrpB [Xanthomonadales bacterium]|nr:ATP-dependent helicase HrpB [Xanthomonadales bacterium]